MRGFAAGSGAWCREGSGGGMWKPGIGNRGPICGAAPGGGMDEPGSIAGYGTMGLFIPMSILIPIPVPGGDICRFNAA